MDDVLSEIVFTGRDKDLGTRNVISTIFSGHCTGFDQTQVSTAVWLRQAHGASPNTFYQFGEVCRLLLVGTVMTQRIRRTMRQARVHTPR